MNESTYVRLGETWSPGLDGTQFERSPDHHQLCPLARVAYFPRPGPGVLVFECRLTRVANSSRDAAVPSAELYRREDAQTFSHFLPPTPTPQSGMSGWPWLEPEASVYAGDAQVGPCSAREMEIVWVKTTPHLASQEMTK